MIQQLKEKGVVTRGALGVEVQPVTPDIAHALGLKKVEGALVAEAPPGGAAAEAGIVPGDVVLAVDGRPIASGADLAAKIGSMAPGTAVKITILRDGSERTIPVTLGELPGTPFKPAQPSPATGAIGTWPDARSSPKQPRSGRHRRRSQRGCSRKGFDGWRHYSRCFKQSGAYAG